MRHKWNFSWPRDLRQLDWCRFALSSLYVYTCRFQYFQSRDRKILGLTYFHLQTQLMLMTSWHRNLDKETFTTAKTSSSTTTTTKTTKGDFWPLINNKSPRISDWSGVAEWKERFTCNQSITSSCYDRTTINLTCRCFLKQLYTVGKYWLTLGGGEGVF